MARAGAAGHPDPRSPVGPSEDLAKYIDHTLLKFDATDEQIDRLCEEAKQFGFKVGPQGCWRDV